MHSISEIWPELQRRVVELAESGHTDAVEILLGEHPEIRENSRLLLQCIRAEWTVLARQGQPRDLADYALRFPECADSLSELLAANNPQPPSSAGDQLISAGSPSAETSLADATTANAPQPSQLSNTFVPMVDVAQVLNGKIGRYEILREIARGGMGVVYKAYDPQLDRMVAVKLIKSGEFADREQIQRFQTEARAAAQLHHSGIVPVYEVGQQDSLNFLVMEFVEGKSLSQEVADAPLNPQSAARFMQQVAEAVQFAHDRGIIHRDLKPQNILLASDGRPRILDFGLAKRQQHDSSLTETGQILGTPSYMSPEQAQGKTDQVGRHSDVYSLGATLYYLLTGRPPFRGESQFETITQVVHREPVAPRRFNAAIPRDLETICLKCLQKQPGQRYASAQAVSDDLASFLQNETIQAKRPSQLIRVGRWIVQHWVLSLIIASLVIQGMVFVGWFLHSNSPATRDPSPATDQASPNDAEPQPTSKTQTSTISSSPPQQTLIPGNVLHELFDGRSLTGWRVQNGSFNIDPAPPQGPVLSIQGIANCVLVNSDEEELTNYRLQLTVYTHEAEDFVVTFNEILGVDVPSFSYNLVLSAKASYLERHAADGREKRRISEVSPFLWNPSIPRTIVLELQNGWWFVSVDDSHPIAVPRSKREPLRKFSVQTQGDGPAWIKSVQVIDLIEPPSQHRPSP